MSISVLENKEAVSVLSASIWRIDSAFIYGFGKLAGIEWDVTCEIERISEDKKIHFTSTQPMPKDDIRDVRVYVDLKNLTATVEYKKIKENAIEYWETTDLPVKITYTVTNADVCDVISLTFLIGEPEQEETTMSVHTLANGKSISADELSVKYKEWREISEEMLHDGMGGSIDCGESAVRKDFTAFAGLQQEISFEDMLKLEQIY